LLKCLPMRFRTFSCLAAFLQILEMCVLQESLKSIVMPSNCNMPETSEHSRRVKIAKLNQFIHINVVVILVHRYIYKCGVFLIGKRKSRNVNKSF
jgi:hypothetical protein